MDMPWSLILIAIKIWPVWLILGFIIFIAFLFHADNKDSKRWRGY